MAAPKKKKRPPPNPNRPLSPKARAFAIRYPEDMNATKSALAVGYSAKTAYQLGFLLLKDPRVQAIIQEEIARRAAETRITADRVLEVLWARATADPRELIEYRRTCCRNCWGVDFDHQRTARELARDRRTWLARKEPEPEDVFNEMGGPGYDARKDPNQHCPECFGAGVEHVFVHDTRQLSSAARHLYAGVKTTKDGLEVKMHDQDGALTNVMRHLGMLKDVVEHRDLTLEDLLREAELPPPAGNAGDGVPA